jgi:hypothetical protein
MASDPNRRERLRRGRAYIDRVYRAVDARAIVAVTLPEARGHRHRVFVTESATRRMLAEGWPSG